MTLVATVTVQASARTRVPASVSKLLTRRERAYRLRGSRFSYALVSAPSPYYSGDGRTVVLVPKDGSDPVYVAALDLSDALHTEREVLA